MQRTLEPRQPFLVFLAAAAAARRNPVAALAAMADHHIFRLPVAAVAADLPLDLTPPIPAGPEALLVHNLAVVELLARLLPLLAATAAAWQAIAAKEAAVGHLMAAAQETEAVTVVSPAEVAVEAVPETIQAALAGAVQRA
jgi:hypothetical protein